MAIFLIYKKILTCMSIFSANCKVNMNLCSSYSPLTAYLQTSNVKYSMMLAIRFCGIGDFCDLKQSKVLHTPLLGNQFVKYFKGRRLII